MFTTSAPVVGVHAPSGAPTALRGPRPGRPAAPSDPRPEPTTTRQPAGSYNQPPPTPPQATGHQQTRLVGLGRSPGRHWRVTQVALHRAPRKRWSRPLRSIGTRSHAKSLV